jgi:hypothetical protein
MAPFGPDLLLSLARIGAEAIGQLAGPRAGLPDILGHTRIEVSEKYMGYAPAGDEADRLGALFEAQRAVALAE